MRRNRQEHTGVSVSLENEHFSLLPVHASDLSQSLTSLGPQTFVSLTFEWYKPQLPLVEHCVELEQWMGSVGAHRGHGMVAG